MDPVVRGGGTTGCVSQALRLAPGPCAAAERTQLPARGARGPAGGSGFARLGFRAWKGPESQMGSEACQGPVSAPGGHPGPVSWEPFLTFPLLISTKLGLDHLFPYVFLSSFSSVFLV